IHHRDDRRGAARQPGVDTPVAPHPRVVKVRPTGLLTELPANPVHPVVEIGCPASTLEDGAKRS
ncbi:MAG: hypothetical protein L0I24_23085, partial [Pseudonocardia sp.]|nr:hypothetical protein [Pseudonocardia sp.]